MGCRFESYGGYVQSALVNSLWQKEMKRVAMVHRHQTRGYTNYLYHTQLFVAIGLVVNLSPGTGVS